MFYWRQLTQVIEFLEVPPTIRPSLFGPIIKAKKRKFKNERQQIHFFSITDGVQKVKENKGGIYISSAAHLVSQCGVKTLPLGYQEKQLFSPYLSPFIPPRAPVK